MTDSTISILIVDDDKLITQLLYDFLNTQIGLEVKTTLNSGNELLDYLEETTEAPDVIILDLKMKDGTGLETIDVLQRKYSSIRVIALSSYYQLSYSGHLFKLGFSAFLPKNTDKEEIVTIIQEVFKKGHYFSLEQIVTLRNQINAKSPSLILNTKDKLSTREIEVLQLLCQQYTAKEIARNIYISTKTVEAHKSNLLLKTGTKNTAGLIVYAIQNGIVDGDQLVIIN